MNNKQQIIEEALKAGCSPDEAQKYADHVEAQFDMMTKLAVMRREEKAHIDCGSQETMKVNFKCGLRGETKLQFMEIKARLEETGIMPTYKMLGTIVRRGVESLHREIHEAEEFSYVQHAVSESLGFQESEKFRHSCILSAVKAMRESDASSDRFEDLASQGKDVDPVAGDVHEADYDGMDK